MGLCMVFMYNFLHMSIFHSAFQFLSYLRRKKNDNTARCSVDLWTMFRRFKVPGYRSEEMLNKIWCTFMRTHFPFCKWQRTDILIQTTSRRLTINTIATLNLYLMGLQGLPVSYEKMRFPTQHSHASLPWIVQILMEWLIWLCRKFPCCD